MRLLWVVALLLFCGCQMNEPNQIDRLRELAVSRMRKEMPDKIPDTTLPTMVTDKGDSWEVSFYWYRKSVPTVAPKVLVKKDDKGASGQQLEQLRAIASEYVGNNHPDWVNELQGSMVVADFGSYWRVWFWIGAPGGSPTVNIDKASGRVIEAFHTM
jgi:hypothetical protein